MFKGRSLDQPQRHHFMKPVRNKSKAHAHCHPLLKGSTNPMTSWSPQTLSDMSFGHNLSFTPYCSLSASHVVQHPWRMWGVSRSASLHHIRNTLDWLTAPSPHTFRVFFYKFHIVKNVKMIELILLIIITCRLANTRQIEQISFSTTEVCMGPRQNQNGHFNTKLCVCVGGGFK